ncbi:MAG: hypothetical protein ABH879_06820 [archaeon]
MHKETKKRMKDRSWSKEEIEHTDRLMTSPRLKEKHSHYRESSQRIIYWIAVYIMIIGNFMVAVALMPFLILLSGISAYAVVFSMGLIIGLIFNVLIQDLEHLHTRHKILGSLLVPILAILNIIIIVQATNRISDTLSILIHNSAVLLSVVYAAAFIIPYIYSQIKQSL